MNTETNKTIMRQVIKALDQGDWATIEQHPGLYETLEHFPQLLAAFPDMQTSIDQDEGARCGQRRRGCHPAAGRVGGAKRLCRRHRF